MDKQLIALIAMGFGVSSFIVFILFAAAGYIGKETESAAMPRLVATVDGCKIYEVLSNRRYLYVAKCSDGSTMVVTTP